MSKEIIGIGSESRPPVLVMGEYQQWKRRMIHFLDLLDENLLKSIREGPIRPTVTVAAVPRTDNCPELPAYVVEKPVDMYNPEQRASHLIDKRALTLLIMALPNDMYARVDSLTNARDVWLEIEQQMQGGDTALESQKESALNAYEGFKARENESLTESYQRLKSFVNDLRSLGVEKTKYEVNVKFLKNLTPEWQNLAINIQLSRNLGVMGLHDLFSMMVQHEEFITGGRTKKAVDPLALSAVPVGGPNSAPIQPTQYNNGRFRNEQGRYREDQGRFRDKSRRDNTYLDYQGGSGSQGNWRGQNPDYNYQGNTRQYTSESGYNNRQGYEGGYGDRNDGGRHDQGPGYGFEQDRNDRWSDERMDHGKGNYNGGDQWGSSSRQAPREDQPVPADQGGQRSNQPPIPMNQNPAPQPTASPTTTCYKCGKLGHYARDCSVKYKDAAYFEKKAALMRKKEKGVALLVDEENWVCEEESSDEDDHMVKGLCLMADFEGPEAVGPSTYQDIDPSEREVSNRKGHVRQTVTYTEVINGETITRTTSPSNSTSGSPPMSPAPNRPIFVPASDPTNTQPTWEGIKARTPRVAMPPINYTDLNTSYDTREMDLSEETLVIPPEDVSATKSPNLVKLEKEVFELRLKAMDLDACQHQILNLRVIVSEKDTLVHTLEKDLLEANAERIRLTSECETATSVLTNFKTKVADLQTRYILQDIHFEITKEIYHDERMMYRQSLTNQGVSISLLRRKVMDFENFYSLDSDDDTTYHFLNHSMANPKPKPDLDPNVAYDVKVFLDEGDDPSGLIPKKKKSVCLKPEKPAKPQASGSEKSNPKGAKRVGTDREKSVKPHTPKGLQNKKSNSNDACASVKPIKGLDFNSSTFDVGETSRVKPNQPFNSTKPNFSKLTSGKGGKSISVKPSSNSHHALNADGRRKDGGKNVKPPRKDHQERNNTFLAFPKKRSPGCPVRPTVTVAAVPRTDTCPELPSYVVEKPVEMYNPEQRARYLVDKRALTLLIMALPNDMYARVDSLTNARDVWLEIEQQMQGGDTALESQKESALNAYEGFKARENEPLTESYQRLNSFVNDLRRLGVEKTKYEVNMKFLKNLTPEWQNMAINIQLSRNLGVMGLHDLFSMMVQHEEFITGGRTKKAVDPLALAAVPFGGPNSVPIQPTQYNNVPPQYHQEDYNQEFNPNLGPSIQHPDDPLIITISDEELFNVNESLALISHNVQKLNANRGFNRSRG
ncbi:hypothetical protein OSB04_016782 [Centaurea solstitialis]|uniref:CCHC-type domain-containing protein n=1 Tax=Centaurea solstitialis TaxID=347529 RepID=A0AA38WA44_9ASTR|nr:hypothetical protein OSB04_016782 [Centaurea solstitialis]